MLFVHGKLHSNDADSNNITLIKLVDEATGQYEIIYKRKLKLKRISLLCPPLPPCQLT